MCIVIFLSLVFFFFNDTATTEIYTLSLHDALPISVAAGVVHHYVEARRVLVPDPEQRGFRPHGDRGVENRHGQVRSEEHTSELQSRQYLVCRLLLEKKKKNIAFFIYISILHSTSNT